MLGGGSTMEGEENHTEETISRLLSEMNDTIKSRLQVALDSLNQIGVNEETKELPADE